MKKIYAIRDRVANDLVTMQMYSLMTFHNDQSATRYFADAILDPKSILNKHPADYELIVCGHVNQDGHIEQEGWDAPEIVITGSALIAAQPDAPQEQQLQIFGR